MALRQIQYRNSENQGSGVTKAKQTKVSSKMQTNFKKPTVLTSRTALSNIGNRKPINVTVKGKISKPNITQKQPTTKPIRTSSISSRLPTKTSIKPPAASVSSECSLNQMSKPTENATVEADFAVQDEICPTMEPMEIGVLTGAFKRKLILVNVEDEADKENPQSCSEYVKKIYEYLHKLEIHYQPDPNYMQRQVKINPKMRCILVDWLVLVQVKFNLLQETLFLTVSIIDRFLEAFPASKEQLQLIGVTAMLIASKYEEIYYPQLQDFIYITDNSYTGEEMRQMERIILRTLDYSLSMPAPIHFLRRYSKVTKVSAKTHTMAKFLIELSLPEYHMLKFVPSKLAASSLGLAMKLQGEKMEQWMTTIQYYSNYSDDDLKPCMIQLAQLVFKMPMAKQQAVREKYSNSKFLKISKDPALYAEGGQ